jgi:hypothetical protein
LADLGDFSEETGEGKILENRWLQNREDLLVANVIHDNYFVEIEQQWKGNFGRVPPPLPRSDAENCVWLVSQVGQSWKGR